MSVKIKISGVFLEEDGTRYPVETKEDVERFIDFGRNLLGLFEGGNSVTYGGAPQSSVLIITPSTPVQSVTQKVANVHSPPAAWSHSKNRYLNPFKGYIQEILDSKSIPPRTGVPQFGERGIDYIIRAFVHLGAIGGNGKYVTFPELCFDVLKSGMGIKSDTADKAISTVRSMIRGTEVEKLIDKVGEGMNLTRIPEWAKYDSGQQTGTLMLSDADGVEPQNLPRYTYGNDE